MKARSFSASCLSILLVTATAVSAAMLNDVDRLQFANSLLARGLNDAAIAELTHFLDEVPGSVHADEAHFRLGFAYRAMERFADADREYRTVFESYPASAFRIQAGFERAMLVYEQKDYPTAIIDFKALLAAGPEAKIASMALYLCAESHRMIHEPAAALVEYRQLRDQYPDTDMYPYALLRVGEILSAVRGQELEALAAFDKLLSLPVGGRMLAEAAFQKGELLFRQKKYVDASGAYGRLMDNYAGDFRAVECVLHAGWSFYYAGQFSNALAQTEKAIDTGSTRAEWMYLKANCLRECSRTGEAGETYAGLLQTFPDDPLAAPARYELALLQFMQKRFPVVIDLVTASVSSGNADAKTIWLLAESQAAVSNSLEAARYYELLLTTHPDFDHAADACYRLGYQYRQLARLDVASGWYEKAADTYTVPALSAQALMAAASCRMGLNDDGAARVLFAKLIEKHPDDPIALDGRYEKAMCEVRLKKNEEALVTLREFAGILPPPARSFEAQYWIGVLERQSARLGEAETALKAALLSPQTHERWLPNARVQLAGVLQASGKLDEAAVMYQQLLGTEEGGQLSPDLLSWLSDWAYDKKDFVQSASAARQLIQNSTDPALIQAGASQLGKALLAVNDVKGAEQAFENAVGQPVQTHYAPESSLRLAELKRVGGDLVAASNYFSKAAEWSKDETGEGVRVHAYLGMARTASQGHDTEQAAKYFMSVGLLYRDPDIVPECLYEAASLYQQLGHTNEMAQALKDLRAIYPDSDWTKKAQTLSP